jgi:hypothetical protein
MADIDKDAQFASEIRDQGTDDIVMTTVTFSLVVRYSITSSYKFNATQLEENWFTSLAVMIHCIGQDFFSI